MRTISDYAVNPVNDRLVVTVLDEPGAGGANHEYRVDTEKSVICRISFQNGPIAENGVNGVTQEVLLSIVADRLRSFQAGPYACRDNAVALTKVEEAMMWLQRRTLERMRRGVEGTSAK